MTKYLPKIDRDPIIGKINISAPIEEIYSCFSDKKNTSFLNSSLESDAGRFSFIGIDPFVTVKNMHLEDTLICVKNKEIPSKKDPFGTLNDIFDLYNVNNPTPFPFIAGGMGYFSYDLKNWIEELPDTARDDLAIPDMCFTLYQTLLIFDKTAPEEIYFSILNISDPRYKTPAEIIDIIKETIANAEPARQTFILKNNVPGGRDLRSSFTKSDYITAVKKVLDHIKAGDIYQACLSQRFSTTWSSLPYDLYLKLNQLTPTSFGAFLNLEDYQIVSSSPERFLNAHDGVLETRPMKGTRPRGKNENEDNLMKKELQESAKDKAELLMIVDLERNDLGRTGALGSIKVVEPRRIETYSTVFQAISVIKSRLDKKHTLIDALISSFPGGSITGCPKIRAMEIIDELEPVKRGVYTGAIGYISFHETMDLNMAIRTMIIKNKNVYFHVGGGIVSDSDPEKEYEETMHKARALIQSLS